MANALTQRDLVLAFRALGVREGMALEVHSSLSSFGCVEGGAETVIAALMESVGESGSIFMPALRLSPELALTDEDRALGITTKIRVLPEERGRTAMGAIADAFRMRADTVTGGGIMQIAGWGAHAEEAATGGLDYVLKNGGMALMLGVDIYKLTAMHYVEYLLPEGVTRIFGPNEQAARRYPEGEWFVETGRPPIKAWYTIQQMADERGLIRRGRAGSCEMMFFSVGEVVGLYKDELTRDPYALYGVKRPAPQE